MTQRFSANIFSVVTALVIAFQLALVAGAPWGALTQGGRIAGALPFIPRAIALSSAVLLGLFVYVIRARAGSATRFPRASWAVVAYCALGIVANAATPSPAERRLWLPVVCSMFLASLHIARRPGTRAQTGVV